MSDIKKTLTMTIASIAVVGSIAAPAMADETNPADNAGEGQNVQQQAPATLQGQPSAPSATPADPPQAAAPQEIRQQAQQAVDRAQTAVDNVRIPAHFRFCSSLRC